MQSSPPANRMSGTHLNGMRAAMITFSPFSIGSTTAPGCAGANWRRTVGLICLAEGQTPRQENGDQKYVLDSCIKTWRKGEE